MKITKNPVTGKWELVENPSLEKYVNDPNQVPCARDSVLIVDDEAAIQRSFSMAISVYVPNVRVDVAGNGKAALECFRTTHHAVILMDFMMPGMNGEIAFNEISRLCMQQKWTMPAVVFFTGHNPSPTLKALVASDPRHCMIQKPVRNQVLVDAVRSRLQL
jgi:CheY-like chemotaxis protein